MSMELTSRNARAESRGRLASLARKGERVTFHVDGSEQLGLYPPLTGQRKRFGERVESRVPDGDGIFDLRPGQKQHRTGSSCDQFSEPEPPFPDGALTERGLPRAAGQRVRSMPPVLPATHFLEQKRKAARPNWV